MTHAPVTLKDFDRAEQWFNKALELKPDLNSNEFLNLYLEQGKIKKATELAEEKILSDTTNEYSYADQALIFQSFGLSDNVITWLQKAIEINPRNAWHHMGLAGVYVEQGLHD